MDKAKPFNVEPEVILARAYERIANGWTKGSLFRGGDYQHGGEPASVCLVGSLDASIVESIAEQYHAENPTIDMQDIRLAIRQMPVTYAIRRAFENALLLRVKQAGGHGIEAWNDTPGRTKSEVLAVMKLALEDMVMRSVAAADAVPLDLRFTETETPDFVEVDVPQGGGEVIVKVNGKVIA